MTYKREIDQNERPAAQSGLQIWTSHSRLFDTNSGIFAADGQALLVDPGIYPDEVQEILATTDQKHLSLQAVLLTHSHWDHILGPETLPGTPVIAQAAFWKTANEQRETILREITAWESRHGIPRVKPFDLPVPELVFEQELEFYLGEESLHFLAAPGHAADQCVVYHPASGSLWAADMLSDLEIPLVSSSLVDYRRTLAMIAGLDIQSLVPGHGKATGDPQEIQARLAGDRAYLDELDEMVNQAVGQGKSIEESVNFCLGIPYRQGAENAAAHRLNIESAYLEAGGGLGGRAAAGWAQVG